MLNTLKTKTNHWELRESTYVVSQCAVAWGPTIQYGLLFTAMSLNGVPKTTDLLLGLSTTLTDNKEHLVSPVTLN